MAAMRSGGISTAVILFFGIAACTEEGGDGWGGLGGGSSGGPATDGGGTDGATGDDGGDTTDPGDDGDDGTTTDGGDDGTDTGSAECGNGVVEGDEACDGQDDGGLTCADFGFDHGELLCTVQCTALTDACYTCGDGEKAELEACDPPDFGGATCVSLGFGGGSLTCSPDCTEIQTDSCEPLPTCGDGTLNGTEQCEGTDMGGETCQTQGYDMGNLTCNADCTFNTSGCEYDEENCAGQGEFCIFDENDLQSNCCPPGVKGNVLGICDIFICI
jgi:hypothetical protein